MITYVNSKDAKLFELAAAELNMPIGSLDIDQYLNNLSALRAKSPRFVRLPLYEEGHEDEEIFLINANERTIKIPASFSKNGVGVVSDEFAEILWFRINRYFDIKDFGKATEAESLQDGDLHILIQWEAPDGANGASWAYAIDKDTDPEYIYFGWAITAEHLTAKAGNIKFAIRIMQYGADGIEYSFATQAAAVAVKAGLSFDLTDEGVVFEEVADKISSRLMGGQIAYCPVFAPASEELPNGGNLPPYILNLEVPIGAPDDVAKAKLEVVATAPEGTDYDAIAYKWYKKGSDDEEFHQIEGEYTPALTVTSSGEYYVVVFGMIEIVDNNEFIYDSATDTATEGKFKYHTSVASTKSVVCAIPIPDALKITEEMANVLILGDEAALTLIIERQTIDENVVGDVSLKIEKTATAEKDLDLETAEFEVVDLSSTPGSPAVTEAWIWDEVEYATEEEAIAAKGEEEGEIIHREAQEAIPATEAPISYVVDDGSVVIDMSNAEEGYYKVTVINTLNGDHKDTESEVICRVVRPAAFVAESAVVSAVPKPDKQNPSEEPSASDYKLVATAEVDGLSDSLSIRWYEQVGSLDPADETPDTLWDEGAFEEHQEYYPDHGGYFYFVAVNKVEDTTAEITSNIIKLAA